MIRILNRKTVEVYWLNKWTYLQPCSVVLRHNSIKSQNWLHESALSGLTVLLSISLAETKNTNLLPSSIFCTTLISFAKNSAARSKCCSVKVSGFDKCLFGQTFNQTTQRPSQGKKKWRNCKVAYYDMYLMAIRVVEFSNGVYKIRKIFA